MERLNIFNPYEKDMSHEDVLSRNFLILVKNIPSVQMAFLELIRNKMPQIGLESIALGQLSVTESYTQVVSGNLLAGIQEHRILSIIISDDKYDHSHVVKESTRKARYDGVIICEPGWVFIIENKPFVGNIWEGQLDPNEEDKKGNKLIQQYCSLSWREIIEILNSIIERDMISYLEKNIINDFLEYINEAYPWLNPYSRLGFCKGIKWLINRRCGDIIKACFEGKELKYHRGWKYYIDTSAEDSIVKQVALDGDENEITLWMYGGDTMSSARDLYRNINNDVVRKLLDEKYLISSNFHFSFQGTGLVWFSSSEIDILDYIDFWKEKGGSNEIQQVDHDDVEEYYTGLASKKIIDRDDEKIREKIITKRYQKLNVCPGVFFGYKWPMDVALRLDNEGQFIDECKRKINRIRSAYNVAEV